MLDSTSTKIERSPLIELVQYSNRALRRKPAKHNNVTDLLTRLRNPRTGRISYAEISASTQQHAPPLMPLRSRDESALAEFFDVADMGVIANDIDTNLEWRSPEPIWDEDDFTAWLCSKAG